MSCSAERSFLPHSLHNCVLRNQALVEQDEFPIQQRTNLESRVSQYSSCAISHIVRVTLVSCFDSLPKVLEMCRADNQCYCTDSATSGQSLYKMWQIKICILYDSTHVCFPFLFLRYFVWNIYKYWSWETIPSKQSLLKSNNFTSLEFSTLPLIWLWVFHLGKVDSLKL